MQPTFSPDGQQIAFVRNNVAAPVNGDDIMLVSANGGTPTRLALPGDQRTPAWSADGRWIAVTGTAIAGRGVQEIYTMRADGSGLRLRTVNPGWGGGANPPGSPDNDRRQQRHQHDRAPRRPARAIVCAAGIDTPYVRAGRGEAMVIVAADVDARDVQQMIVDLAEHFLVLAAAPAVTEDGRAFEQCYGTSSMDSG
jgi:dipeptidyl aminopeptidase/acylaminoacyl peptidase